MTLLNDIRKEASSNTRDANEKSDKKDAGDNAGASVGNRPAAGVAKLGNDVQTLKNDMKSLTTRMTKLEMMVAEIHRAVAPDKVGKSP